MSYAATLNNHNTRDRKTEIICEILIHWLKQKEKSPLKLDKENVKPSNNCLSALKNASYDKQSIHYYIESNTPSNLVRDM